MIDQKCSETSCAAHARSCSLTVWQIKTVPSQKHGTETWPADIKVCLLAQTQSRQGEAERSENEEIPCMVYFASAGTSLDQAPKEKHS